MNVIIQFEDEEDLKAVETFKKVAVKERKSLSQVMLERLRETSQSILNTPRLTKNPAESK